jgi:hypothetical protein
MSVSPQSRLLELRVELWKARSLAKLRWLEGALSEPAKGPRGLARRTRWVKRALRAIERRQVAVRVRIALLNTYGEHLNGLQRILARVADDLARAASAQPGSPPSPPDPGAAGRGKPPTRGA